MMGLISNVRIIETFHKQLPRSYVLLPTVAVYSNNFLPLSKNWIYRELTGLQGVRRIVLTKELINKGEFPFDPIYCLDHEGTQKTKLSEHRNYWKRTLIDENVRLVHTYFAYSALDILPIVRELGIPLVVTVLGDDIFRFKWVPRYRLGYQELFHSVSRILAVSELLRQEVIDLGCVPEKVYVHHLGVPLDEFQFCARGHRAGEPVTFFHVSNFAPKKGIDVLIRAYRRVRDQLPHSELVLAGYGDGVDRAKSLAVELGIEQAVRFTGPCLPKNVGEAMRSHHIFVHPSLTPPEKSKEGIPVALSEALATGMPAIATRHSGIPELVLDSVNGWLVEEGNETELAERMVALAKAPETWASLGKAGRDHVASEFNLSKQNARLGVICTDLLNADSPPHEPLRYVLITNYGLSNEGDTAFLFGMINGIRRSLNCKIHILTPNWPQARKAYPELSFQPTFNEAIRKEAETVGFYNRDKFISGLRRTARIWAIRDRLSAFRGFRILGRLLSWLLKRTSQYIHTPAQERILKIYRRCDIILGYGCDQQDPNDQDLNCSPLELQIARILGKPLVIDAQSLARMDGPANGKALRVEFRRAALVLARDTNSLQSALSLGTPVGRTRLTVDPIFNLPPVSSPSLPRSAGDITICLSLRKYTFPEDHDRADQLIDAYRRTIVALCLHLLDTYGATLTFMSALRNRKKRNEELAFAEELTLQLPKTALDSISIDRAPYHPLKLQEYFTGFDLHMGTQMYTIALALRSYVPVVGIACEQEVEELMSQVGLASFFQSIDNLNPNLMTTLVDRAISERASTREHLINTIASLRDSAQQSTDLLRRLIG